MFDNLFDKNFDEGNSTDNSFFWINSLDATFLISVFDLFVKGKSTRDWSGDFKDLFFTKFSLIKFFLDSGIINWLEILIFSQFSFSILLLKNGERFSHSFKA